jgi:predicted DNA-binding WGR domain protein
MSDVLYLNNKITLKNQEGKVIEIENKAESNYITSIGKLGLLPSYKKYSNAEAALDKANQLIQKKLSKGYIIQIPEVKGEYLEKGDFYWKSLICGNELKTQSGNKGKIPENNVFRYKNSDEAEQKAKLMLRQHIAKGFIRNPSKFTSDFENLKGTVILDPLENLNQHCKIEISEDEEEEEKENQPTSMLKRSKMIDIDENVFPKTTALHLSSLNLLQVVEDEQENGLVTSYVFEKPELESSNTSVITEILEEPELPKKRPRNSKYSTIQSMLHSLGLGRYVLNFETKGVSIGSFINMTDDQLKQVGIPKKAREKIIESKMTGSWDPVLTSSIILPDQEELKTTQKKSLNPDIKIDPNFVIEQGTGKPPDKIEMLLAHTWDDSIDPTGWWLSEKLDGVRCYWSGSRFYSRNGNQFYPPPFFTAHLPKTVSLDGELWMGRKMFQKCVGIIKRQDAKKHDMNEWAKIVYVIFDAPSLKGNFERRLHYIYNLAEKLQSPYVRAHEHRKCNGLQDMLDEQEKVEGLGGEGLMLRQPASFYEHKRSNTLLKVKSFVDAEATVIGHKSGTGRCQGMMGALLVRADNGIEFKIGSGFNDQQRKNPPKKGSRVTYKYQELSNSGKPRFPIFLRIHPGL